MGGRKFKNHTFFRAVILMSIINCNRRDCGYQKDGKCEFNSVTPIITNSAADCVYFSDARGGGNVEANAVRPYGGMS